MAGYWMNEASGILRPAVEAYLNGEKMTGEQIAVMRAYLKQWIADPVWQGPAVDALRRNVDEIESQTDIGEWLVGAENAGMDPL